MSTPRLARRLAVSLRSPRRSYATSIPPTSSASTPAAAKTGSRKLLAVSSALALGTTAYALGSIYPPSVVTLLFPRPTVPHPPAHTPEALAYTESLEQELHALPTLAELRAAPDAAEWYECRPYQTITEQQSRHSLTSGALRGPGRLALPPLVRAKRDESEAVVIMHLGRGLCGHEGIVHGGLLATLLDESLGRLSILNMPEKVAVTAKLALNYRAPTRADQFVIIKTKIVEKNGRKMTVFGSIETLDGTVLCDATALFVQPKYANLMNTSALIQAMGQPPAEVPKPDVAPLLSGKEAAP